MFFFFFFGGGGGGGIKPFVSGTQGNKCPINRGTGEQEQFLGTGNIIKKMILGNREQGQIFQGNRCLRWEGLI